MLILTIFQISGMFGGLGICSMEAVIGKDDKEYIIEVNDCATNLLGESQEEDRKNIAELVLRSMEVTKNKQTTFQFVNSIRNSISPRKI